MTVWPATGNAVRLLMCEVDRLREDAKASAAEIDRLRAFVRRVPDLAKHRSYHCTPATCVTCAAEALIKTIPKETT